jgi:uncharacterized protein (DUF433 family)
MLMVVYIARLSHKVVRSKSRFTACVRSINVTVLADKAIRVGICLPFPFMSYYKSRSYGAVHMSSVSNGQPAILRTERGLTISGTRISIYDIIDFLKAQYPPRLIQNRFNLTDAQINVALSYIEANKTQVEAEYQEVLQNREEIRQYWEERNRKHFARIAAMPRKPGQEALWAKLEDQKARRNAEKA